MKRIFNIKRKKPAVKNTDYMQVRWDQSAVPYVKTRVELLPKQRTADGKLFITMGGAKKIVALPVVEFYAANIYEALDRIDFREISDITISSSVTSYDGPRRKMPLLMDRENQ